MGLGEGAEGRGEVSSEGQGEVRSEDAEGRGGPGPQPCLDPEWPRHHSGYGPATTQAMAPPPLRHANA